MSGVADSWLSRNDYLEDSCGFTTSNRSSQEARNRHMLLIWFDIWGPAVCNRWSSAQECVVYFLGAPPDIQSAGCWPRSTRPGGRSDGARLVSITVKTHGTVSATSLQILQPTEPGPLAKIGSPRRTPALRTEYATLHSSLGPQQTT